MRIVPISELDMFFKNISFAKHLLQKKQNNTMAKIVYLNSVKIPLKNLFRMKDSKKFRKLFSTYPLLAIFENCVGRGGVS